MLGTVCCADCGFLAIRNIRNRQLVELEFGIRRNEADFPEEDIGPGVDDYHARRTAPIYIPQPICFMAEEEAMEESQSIFAESARYPGLVNKQQFQAFIKKPRLCKSFTSWKHGRTPKEHREMLDHEQLLTFQKEREESDRKWRQSQASQDYVWRRDEARWRRIELVVMGIIVTLVTVVTNVVCAFIQRGDWPKPN